MYPSLFEAVENIGLHLHADDQNLPTKKLLKRMKCMYRIHRNVCQHVDFPFSDAFLNEP